MTTAAEPGRFSTSFMSSAVLLSFSRRNTKTRHSNAVRGTRNTCFAMMLCTCLLAIRQRFREASNDIASRKLSFGRLDASGVSGRIFDGSKVRSVPVSPKGANRRKSTVPWDSLEIDKTKCTDWAVSTTIFNVSDAVRSVCERLIDTCLVVVLDEKSNQEYHVSGGCKFMSLTVKTQLDLAARSKFIQRIPWNHFGRKNIGHLWAIAHGARTVWDFDDDNILKGDGLLNQRSYLTSDKDVNAYTVRTDEAVLNVYPLLGAQTFAWPRGFPLEHIKDESKIPNYADLTLETMAASSVGFMQSLANIDPDVDAIYRLQRKLPFQFSGLSQQRLFLVLPPSSFAPLNSQASLFVGRASLWSTYLPISVHGRVSDIWRSYILQAIFRDCNLRVAFASTPLVDQLRNPHSYIADLAAEEDLYIKSAALIEFLQSWSSSYSTLQERLIALYEDLYERDFIGQSDAECIRLWVDELESIGYEFPPVSEVKHQPKRNVHLRKEISNPIQGVIGILSAESKAALRNAQRATWIPRVPPHIKVYFLLDKSTDVLIQENDQNGDILFLNSSYTGRAVRFGEKMYKWLVLSHELHPTASFVGKVDDDAYVHERMWTLIEQKYTPHLYMGWFHGFRQHISIGLERRSDEAFVVLGSAVRDFITHRMYCNDSDTCDKAKDLYDTDYGGTSLGLWLSTYDQSLLGVTALNDFSWWFKKLDSLTASRCRHLLVHKISEIDMYRLHIACLNLAFY